MGPETYCDVISTCHVLNNFWGQHVIKTQDQKSDGTAKKPLPQTALSYIRRFSFTLPSIET